MIQPCERLGFAREPLGELRVLLLFACQDFQGDIAVQARLTRLVNHAHAAAPKAFENFQLRKQRRDFRRQRRRV